MAARTVSTPAAEPTGTPSLPATGDIAVVTTQSMPQQTYVERRLVGTVVADQCRHLARVHGQVDVVEDVHRSEALVQLPDLEERLSHLLPFAPLRPCRGPTAAD